MKTEIIHLFDSEEIDYPLIEIKEGSFEDGFKSLLNKYRDDMTDDYNIDDFIEILKKQEWFVRIIYYNREVFF